MRLKTHIYIFILSLLFSTSALAQYSYKQHIKYADKSYELGNFREAMIHYNHALELGESLDEDRIYKYAEAAFNTFSLNTAKLQYQSYLEFDSLPMAYDASYKLARISHLKGDYSHAIVNYNIYLSEYEELDDDITNEVQFLLNQASWANNAEIESTIEDVVHLDSTVNSPHSENAPFLKDDSLYYSSLKYPIQDDKLKRYKSKLLKNQSIVNVPNVSELQLLSNVSFAPDGSFAIYSICDYQDTFEINCSLYYSSVDSTGVFSNPVRLPERINTSGSTTTHPSIRFQDPDYTLFFSSNREGSKGKRDIWSSKFTNEFKFDSPQNITHINTVRDDVTPFFHEGTNVLFFGSDGHNGFGGYDIYKIEENQKDSISISNAGNEINSALNEVYPFVSENSASIYFASNKPGSKYLEDKFETCCYDIYEAEIKDCEIDLIANFFDSFDDTELSEVSVQILDKTNDIVIYNELVYEPRLKLILDCDKEYELIALKKGYQDLNYSLADIKPIYGQKNEIERDVFMDPSDYNLSVSLFDLEEPDLKLTNAEVTLVNTETGEEKSLANGDSNLYNFEILPKTSYKIIADKNAYDETVLEFNSGVGEPDIEKTIYLKKTEIVQVTKVSLKNAIPVRLYFDNDQPDRRTTKETSSQNYTEAYYRYYERYDQFKEIYSSKFPRSQKANAEQEIDELFDGNIKEGFEKYERFKNQLIIVLEAGQKVNIYLRGYASPVHINEYNTALGRRRVDSIRKEFDEWQDGIFIPYIRSGQLIVTERSFGEETAPPGISDDPATPDKSIFSPEASIERRVEIDEINFNEN